MKGEEALAFVRKHGVALASAKGPVPNVVEAVVNAPVKGSWWAHPKGRQIFRILQQLHNSPEILVCRLVDGKVTFVHRRLWPALVRVAQHFPAPRVSQVHEEHTASGQHVIHELPFPRWVPAEVQREAQKLEEREAFRLLGTWATARKNAKQRAIRAARD